MKRAVSVSLGSPQRDKCVTITLGGQEILLERIGTNGDIQKAIALYQQLDGQVDAFGVGGIDLGMTVCGRYYPLRDAQRLVASIRHTPFTDGAGLKLTLERRVAQFIEREIGAEVRPKRALITTGVDRYGSALSFTEAGYEIIFGDLAFALGLPLPLRSLRSLHITARLLLPFVSRLPITFLYPTGQKQESNIPKFERWYRWATVISGDCLYIRRHMPASLAGKTIATNTTTPADVDTFRQSGVRYLVTSTPRLDGRTFGTNLMEAALIALAGKGRPLTIQELDHMLTSLNLTPAFERINP